jgi:hypothetical protein
MPQTLQPIEAIERDLHRTLPTHALFAPARGSTKLPSVLVAVSTPQYPAVPEVGVRDLDSWGY